MLKTTQKRHWGKLDGDAFQLRHDDASDDSNEVCFHITYLFLKALVFVSNVFLLASVLSHENLHSLPIVVSSVFSPESTPLVIQQSPLLYSANLFICLFLICLFISLSLLIFLLSNRSLGTFFHRFRIPFPFPDSGFRIPCFSAAAYNRSMGNSKFNVSEAVHCFFPTF